MVPQAKKNIASILHISLSDSAQGLLASIGVEDLLGFSVAECMAGKLVLRDCIHHHDQDIADELFSKKIQPENVSCNLRLRHANGNIVCVTCNYSKMAAGADGKIILVLHLQDATKIWQPPQDQSMMDNFRITMESTEDYLYFKDRNHVFTGASQSLTKITNPAEHWTDLLGKTCYDVFPEVCADIYYALEKKTFADLKEVYQIKEVTSNTGHKSWIETRKYPIKNIQGQCIGLFCVGRTTQQYEKHDATKRIELTAAELKNRLINIIDIKAHVDLHLVQLCLTNVLESKNLHNSFAIKCLLKYLVKQSLDGNGEKLKGYTLAVDALGCSNDFDSNYDSLVRVYVKRLRDKLSSYYEGKGAMDEIQFHLALGSYNILFLRKIHSEQRVKF